jgi:hypothetical protein
MIMHSAEIRWFFGGKLPDDVRTWFQAIALRPDPDARVDEYVLLPGGNTVGVKLRGGHVFEVKALCKPPRAVSLGHGIGGFTDRWIKWSLESAAMDNLAADLRADAPVMEIGKRRWLVKISLEQNEPAMAGAEAFPTMGCNVEMTELTREGTDWWSFGLEAFGPAPTTEVTLRKAAVYFFDRHTPNFELQPSNSLSYPRWLPRHCDD